MRIAGQTVEERRVIRAQRTVENRAETFKQRIAAAKTGREVLAHACNYAQAVGKPLDDFAKREFARLIVALADERNKP